MFAYKVSTAYSKIMPKPRSEIFFPTIQTPLDTNYVPKPTRNEREAELLKGKPTGIVIARNQRIGLDAGYTAYLRLIDAEESILTVDSLGSLLSSVALGTSYHLYAQQDAQKVMYRRVKIPRLDNRSSYDGSEDIVDEGLDLIKDAAIRANSIQEKVLVGEPIEKDNRKLGRSLARAGVTLAVVDISDTILPNRDNLTDRDIQNTTWFEVQRAYQMMLELSGTIGSRPTVAQLADEQSPLRRHMNDDRAFVAQRAHTVLLEQIEEARAA